MKIKFLSIFAAASLLVACGGGAEEAHTELEAAIEEATEVTVEEVEAVVEEVTDVTVEEVEAVVEEVPAH
jgi:hypothetical protein